MAEKKEKKKSSYISAGESRRITRFNRKLTKQLEADRANANKDQALYTTQMRDPNNVVEFDNVCTYFFTDVGTVKAVDGISFDIPRCSTVGVVGESGCGKSVTSLSLMQLLQRPSGQVVGGEIRFNIDGSGKALNIVNTPTAKMQEIRGNRVSMIFQEPMTSLNPVFRIGAQVDEVLQLHHPEMTKEQMKERTLEMLDMVGIANKEGVYDMYPHELSGGMRQRVMIAIALACRPRLLIADEPTTALDVTIQAQIMELIASLNQKLDMGVILITHDLAVVSEMCSRVAVMYLGQIVEEADVLTLFERPLHPYTRGLLKSIPTVRGGKREELSVIEGTVPLLSQIPQGCRFRPRCPYATPSCGEQMPGLKPVGEGHRVRCFLCEEVEKEAWK